jgi:hypothetical protein
MRDLGRDLGRRPGRAPGRARTARAAGTIALLAALAACTGGSDGTTDPSSSPEAEEDSSWSAATFSAVSGTLDEAGQATLSEEIAEVVDGWLQGAYLGDFPRADFAPAFESFTKGARTKALEDSALTTSSALSDRIESAEATSRELVLDVMAIGNKAIGVSADVALEFETTGTLASTQTVNATLDLTQRRGRWSVFGYTITKGPVAP